MVFRERFFVEKLKIYRCFINITRQLYSLKFSCFVIFFFFENIISIYWLTFPMCMMVRCAFLSFLKILRRSSLIGAKRGKKIGVAFYCNYVAFKEVSGSSRSINLTRISRERAGAFPPYNGHGGHRNKHVSSYKMKNTLIT